MVIVLAVLGAGLRVEEVVACDELEDLREVLASGKQCQGRRRANAYHSCHAPYVGARSPLGAEDHLGRPVLACLDVVGEVVVDPAGIAEVGDLDADDVTSLHIVGLALLACRRKRRGSLVQRDARDLFGQNIGRFFPLFLALLCAVGPWFW